MMTSLANAKSSHVNYYSIAKSNFACSTYSPCRPHG